jgi:conjugative transposon TraM protein
MAMTEEKKKKVKSLTVLAVILIAFVSVIGWVLFSDNGDKTTETNDINTEIPTATPEELPASKIDEYEVAYDPFLLDEETHMVETTDITELEKEREAQRKMEEDEDREMELQFSQRQLEAISQVEALLNADNNNTNTDNNKKDNNSNNEVEATNNNITELNEREQQLREQHAMALELQRQQLERLQQLTTKDVDDNKDRKEERNFSDITPVKNENKKVSVLRRHNSFYGSNVVTGQERKIIKATIYGKQTVTNGQNVRLRLSEPIQVNGRIIPRNTLITGIAAVSTDRLYISVINVSYNDIIYPVQLEVYDIDGMRGLYVPGSLENEAIRDITQEIANSVGNSAEQAQSSYINNQTATERIKSDVYRGAVGGTARYISKKLAEIKINVQDGHNLYLVLL